MLDSLSVRFFSIFESFANILVFRRLSFTLWTQVLWSHSRRLWSVSFTFPLSLFLRFLFESNPNALNSYSGVPTSVAWLGGNLQGQTKRGVGMAIQIGIGNLGALVSSNVYRTVDAPRYIIGHSTILGAVGMGLICAPLYAYLLRRENAKRDLEQIRQDALPEDQKTRYTVAELRLMGDLAPSFRYTI